MASYDSEDYSDDEESTIEQQIAEIAKNHAKEYYNAINDTLKYVYSARVDNDIKAIINATDETIRITDEIRSISYTVTNWFLQTELNCNDIDYSIAIRTANTSIRPYVILADQCVMEACTIRNEMMQLPKV